MWIVRTESTINSCGKILPARSIAKFQNVTTGLRAAWRRPNSCPARDHWSVVAVHKANSSNVHENAPHLPDGKPQKQGSLGKTGFANRCFRQLWLENCTVSLSDSEFSPCSMHGFRNDGYIDSLLSTPFGCISSHPACNTDYSFEI